VIVDDLDLPDDWEVKPLGEAAQLVKDKVEPVTVPDARYIGLEHVEAHTMRLLGSGRGSDVKSAKTKFAAGDVLYGKLRPYLNKIARPPFDGISSTDFLVFTESGDLDCGFLAQFLNQLSVANYAHHVSTGVELPRVDWKSLSALQIAFPPSKADQRAIVAQIEHARGTASSANNHLDLAQRAIKRFRQAVLAAACSGRLTEDWRDGNPDDNAVNLVETVRSRRPEKYHDASVRKDLDLHEVPNSWVWTNLRFLLSPDEAFCYGVVQPGDNDPNGVYLVVCPAFS
jgi:type I restriction enzyme, S subunit